MSSEDELKRLRWRCRRGMLELDLLLEGFIGHYDELDEAQRVVFDKLLDLPDTLLWDLVSGKTVAERAEQRAVLAMINAA